MSSATSLRDRIKTLRTHLLTGLIERDIPTRLALLAALSGEHLLLIGPPGTAKSELARRLRLAIRDATYFERLLTRFSVPEELFGPLSIKALEDDRYIRQTAGYLPWASIAFIDEIFKANSAILNSLLTLLNEREFDNGTQRMKTPLVSVIGASNELPEGEELAALYDRFLLRFAVEPVSDDAFTEILKLDGASQPKPPPLEARLSGEDLAQIRKDARLVELPSSLVSLLHDLRRHLNKEGVAVSDRRWVKTVSLLKVAAYCDGRNAVEIWDLWLLQHLLWNEPGERAGILEWYEDRVGVGSVADPQHLTRLTTAWERIYKEEKEAKAQQRNKKGNLLYVDFDGKLVTTTKGRRPAMRKNEKLYLAPPQEPDRTNGGEGLTQDELWNKYRYRGYHGDMRIHVNRGVVDLSQYTSDSSNYFYQEGQFSAAMEPTRYSIHHIAGRLTEMGGILSQVEAFLAEIDGQITSLDGRLSDHLWVDPDFRGPALKHLEGRRNKVAKLEGRLRQVRDGFERLPTLSKG